MDPEWAAYPLSQVLLAECVGSLSNLRIHYYLMYPYYKVFLFICQSRKISAICRFYIGAAA